LCGAAAAGAVLCLCGVVLVPRFIPFVPIPAVMQQYSIPLIQWHAVGLIFHYLLIITNGILRACHLVKRSLWTMGLVCILNIALNFLFVFKTPLGFRGIAFSTAVSVAVGCILNCIAVRPLLVKPFSISWRYITKISSIGWPIGLLQILWQTGSAVLFMILGTLPVHAVETLAALTNGLRIESAVFLPAFAFNLSNAVIVGNHLGKGKQEAAVHNGVITAFLGVGFVIVLTALVLLNAPLIAALLSPHPIVIQETIRYLYVCMLSEPLMAWAVILAGGLNGAGDTKSVLMRVTISLWVVRIPLSFLAVVVLQWSAVSVWWVTNGSLAIYAFMISKRYFSKKWVHIA